MKHLRSLFAGIAAVAVMTGTAFATTFTATDTFGRSAEAIFSVSGTNLQVTLANTSNADVMDPTFVLTALFFSGANGLTPISALLPTGTVVFNGPSNGGNVGGEWAYGSGFTTAPHGATAGISSSGLSPSGLFGQPNFNGPNLGGPKSLDGLQYGITSAGDVFSTPGVGDLANNALIKNSVVFTLGGLAANFDINSISNVSFQYGTDIANANITPPQGPTPVPEPGTLLLLGIGGFGLAIWGKRRKSA
ncbi:XDD4 family exosortase-dependent surface protein [Geomonas silvestris]|nr:XDD4 family exosortase-dependent surface protein [Geomonas silvestris]